FFFSIRIWHTIFSRDWSSVVCSSDLPCGKRLLLRAIGHARSLGPGDQLRARRPERGIARADPRRELVDRLARLDPRLECIPYRQIGRASSRERDNVSL